MRWFGWLATLLIITPTLLGAPALLDWRRRRRVLRRCDRGRDFRLPTLLFAPATLLLRLSDRCRRRDGDRNARLLHALLFTPAALLLWLSNWCRRRELRGRNRCRCG